MKKLKILLLLTLPLIAVAEEDGKKAEESKNYCHSAENKQEFEGLLAKHPGDTGIIKLYALRDGLCSMIDAGKVSLDDGIDIWELERSKIVVERTKDELSASHKLEL